MRNGATGVAVGLGAAALLVLGGCRDEPRPAPTTRAGSPPAAARPSHPAGQGGAEGPGAAGISDLARISRYVFAEMQARGPSCQKQAFPPGRYDYVYEVTVRGGRVVAGRLAAVSRVTPVGATVLPSAQWPAALSASLACLQPFLEAMPMAPAPADGTYEARFSATGPG